MSAMALTREELPLNRPQWFNPVQLVAEAVRPQQVLHHAGRTVPVVGPEAVAGGDEARARIEHLVLLVPRAELRTDRVPAGFQEFHLVLRLHAGGALGGMDDLAEHR